MTISTMAYKLLREQGYIVDGIERILQTKIKRDCYGFADKLAISEDFVLLVQETSGSNHSDRRKKLAASVAAQQFVQWDTVVVVLLSFRKKKFRKKDKTWSKKGIWTPKIEIMRPGGFVEVSDLTRETIYQVLFSDLDDFRANVLRDSGSTKVGTRSPQTGHQKSLVGPSKSVI